MLVTVSSMTVSSGLNGLPPSEAAATVTVTASFQFVALKVIVAPVAVCVNTGAPDAFAADNTR